MTEQDRVEHGFELFEWSGLSKSEFHRFEMENEGLRLKLVRGGPVPAPVPPSAVPLVAPGDARNECIRPSTLAWPSPLPRSSSE